MRTSPLTLNTTDPAAFLLRISPPNGELVNRSIDLMQLHIYIPSACGNKVERFIRSERLDPSAREIKLADIDNEPDAHFTIHAFSNRCSYPFAGVQGSLSDLRCLGGRVTLLPTTDSSVIR